MNRYCKLAGVLLGVSFLAWDYPAASASRVALFYIYQRAIGGSYDFGTPTRAVTNPRDRDIRCPTWYMPSAGQYAIVMKAQDKETGELSPASEELTFWWSAQTGCTTKDLSDDVVAEVPPAQPPSTPPQPVSPIPKPPPVPEPPPSSLPPLPATTPQTSTGAPSSSGGITSSCKFWGTCPP